MIWNTAKIEDLCEIKGGKRLPKDHQLTENKTNHPYIRARDIGEGKIDFSKPVYLQENTYNQISRYIVRENDIVLTIVGANIGDVGIIPNFLDGANLTENAVKLRPYKDVCFHRFLLYYFLLPGKKKELEQIAAGSAQGKLGLYKIKEIEVPLPTISVQRRIADVLSAYDDLIENNLRRIQLLEEAVWCQYKILMTSEETVMRKLGEMCNLIMGQSPPSSTYNENGEGLPFHQGVTNYGFRFLTHQTFCSIPSRIADPNDILISVRAPVGRLNFTMDKVCIGRGLSAVRNNDGFQQFQFCQLKDFFFIEDRIGNGSTFNATTKKELESLQLPYPNLKAVSKFEESAEPLHRLMVNLTKQNTYLLQARDILLPRLMSGEIDVTQEKVPKEVIAETV